MHYGPVLYVPSCQKQRPRSKRTCLEECTDGPTSSNIALPFRDGGHVLYQNTMPFKIWHTKIRTAVIPKYGLAMLYRNIKYLWIHRQMIWWIGITNLYKDIIWTEHVKNTYITSQCRRFVQIYNGVQIICQYLAVHLNTAQACTGVKSYANTWLCTWNTH